LHRAAACPFAQRSLPIVAIVSTQRFNADESSDELTGNFVFYPFLEAGNFRWKWSEY
jgi:hypothetical protein